MLFKQQLTRSLTHSPNNNEGEKNNLYSLWFIVTICVKWVHIDLRNLNKYANELTKYKRKWMESNGGAGNGSGTEWEIHKIIAYLNLTTIYDDVLIGCHEVVTITIDLNFECRTLTESCKHLLNFFQSSLLEIRWCSMPTQTSQTLTEKTHWHFVR